MDNAAGEKRAGGLSPDVETELPRCLHPDEVARRALTAAGIKITNDPPVISGSADVHFLEGRTDSVVSYRASDPEGTPVRWSLTGPDADDLVIGRDGVLNFAAAPDREYPDDNNQDNVYEVTVEASDGINTTTLEIKVTVTNLNEPPEVTGSASIDREENLTDPLATYTASDAEQAPITWSLAGTDADDFEISDSGVSRFGVTPDFESPSDSNRDNVYQAVVQASDGTHIIGSGVSVTVSNEEETGSVALSSVQPQVDTLLTAVLSDSDGTVSGVVWSWQRSPNGTSSWTSVAGADSASYTPVVGDVGDFLRVIVSYTDGEGSNKEAREVSAYGVRAAPVTNQAPVFPSTETGTRSVEENTMSGANIGDPVEASDADNDNLTYILSGTEAVFFDIDPSTGQWRTKVELDYERRNRYRVRVIATDPSLKATRIDVTVMLINQDETGSMVLSSLQPSVDTPLTAVLPDPDGRVSGVVWSWERSPDGTSNGAPISGADSDSYKPVTDDENNYLWAVASYTDGAGAGRTARAVSANRVQPAPPLKLSISPTRLVEGCQLLPCW